MEKTVANIEADIAWLQLSGSGRLHITATYEEANTASSITFAVPISEAKRYHIGQRISVAIVVQE